MQPVKRGRPRLHQGDATVCLSVKLLSTDYDACFKAARQARLPLATWIRQQLVKGFSQPPEDR